MKTNVVWKEKMTLVGEAEGNTVTMDAKSPIGGGKGLTPKELVAIGVSGCSAMDVVGLMKKYREPLEALEVKADVIHSKGVQPAVFTDFSLVFEAHGPVSREKLLEAVHLSQTKFCGVSAMLVKAVPLHYTVFLNGEQIGKGEANFDSETPRAADLG